MIENIKNWKLVEVIEEINIVNDKSQEYINGFIFGEMKIPKSLFEGVDRTETQIDWGKMTTHHKFFLDNEGEEEINQKALLSCKLAEKENIIITYGWDEPTVKISTEKFINEWEDFIASTHWETIILSEDLDLILEVTRDYYLHSNFKIK